MNRFVCCRFRHAGAGDEIVRSGSVTIFVMARLRGDQTDSMRGDAARRTSRLGRGVYAERRTLSVAVVRRGGAGTRRPGDPSGRASRPPAGRLNIWNAERLVGAGLLHPAMKFRVGRCQQSHAFKRLPKSESVFSNVSHPTAATRCFAPALSALENPSYADRDLAYNSLMPASCGDRNWL